MHRVRHGGDEPGDDAEFVLGEPVQDGVGAVAERAEEGQPRGLALVGIAEVDDPVDQHRRLSHAAARPAGPGRAGAGMAALQAGPDHQAAGDVRQAVVRGIGHTGRLVTSGALILCLAFTALGGVPVTDVKILATGLAAGIIIDATVIRGVLAPALVAQFGRANWWLPGPAARLLRITPLTASRRDRPHPAAAPGTTKTRTTGPAA
jgi:hypothetical protein